MTYALAAVLAAFGLFKLWIASEAVVRLRAFRAGRPGVVDPMTGFRGPVLFWGWVGWRIAAGLLAIGLAAWLADHPTRLG